MNMGNNFGFPNMTFDHNFLNEAANLHIPDSSSSESEDDVDSSNFHFEMKKPSNCPPSDTIKFSESKITFPIVKKIEDDLELHHYISLIFLLFDTNFGLQEMRTMIASGPQNFTKNKLSKWAQTQQEKWKTMLVEALAVIQHYRILYKLGFTKEEIEIRFFPMRDSTVYLTRQRKMLYRICENLSIEEARNLIHLVCEDGKFDSDITLHCDPRYLEFHVLFWISRDYLQIEREVNLSNLTKHLKVMELFDLVAKVNEFEKSINKDRRNLSKVPSKIKEDFYEIIDRNNVGLVIVINNARFTVDEREEFKGLHAKQRLSNRDGSLSDVKRIKDTFEELNFTVVDLHDINHDDIKPEIQRVLNENFKKTHSVLFLCILSHGEAGKVYGANSVSVSIEEIQGYISGPTSVSELLINKPKVIIIQACQGDEFLYVDPKLEPNKRDTKQEIFSTDCPNSTVGQQEIQQIHAHLLTCKAVIKGYVAVRSVIRGTIYIQELCKCIKEHHRNEHFLDIVTRVQGSLNNKEMKVKDADGQHLIYMTPEVLHRLCKKLYLSPRTEV